MSLEEIKNSQTRWAQIRWPGHKDKLAPSLDDNLFFPMTDSVKEQFLKGSGKEIGTPENPGKMYSLISSSALVYNFFAPWLGHDLAPLVKALGHQSQDRTLRFEEKFPHGLSSTPPNLDVSFDNEQDRKLAVECKYSEPYGAKQYSKPFHDKYFEDRKERWAEQGLPRCQKLANAIGERVKFRRLDAVQLLKHILGLAWTTKKHPRLVYLWFDTKCVEAGEHRDEIKQFVNEIDEEIEFTHLTYQDAFAVLKGYSEPEKGYFDYLANRYFVF